MFLIGYLLIGIAPSYAGEPAQFYRIASTQPTRITSFNSDGTLTFSNSGGNAICRIERSSSTSASSWRTSKPVMWVHATNRTHTIGIPAAATNGFLLEGTVVYLSFEGGFYGITGPLGEHYLPINLPSYFAVHGMPISIGARVRDDLVSIFMWGTIIELFLDPWMYDLRPVANNAFHAIGAKAPQHER
mgnify:CR=1 FL=1